MFCGWHETETSKPGLALFCVFGIFLIFFSSYVYVDASHWNAICSKIFFLFHQPNPKESHRDLIFIIHVRSIAKAC